MIPSLFEFSSKILFPMLCFNAQDLAQWQDDPIEYIRKEFGTSSILACHHSLAHSLTHTTLLPPFQTSVKSTLAHERMPSHCCTTCIVFVVASTSNDAIHL